MKFEDVIHSSAETFLKFQADAGLRLDYKMIKTYYNHHNVNSKRYWSTYRPKDYDPNHWKSELSLQNIRKVEQNCESYMRLLNYEKYNVSATSSTSAKTSETTTIETATTSATATSETTSATT